MSNKLANTRSLSFPSGINADDNTLDNPPPFCVLPISFSAKRVATVASAFLPIGARIVDNVLIIGNKILPPVCISEIVGAQSSAYPTIFGNPGIIASDGSMSYPPPLIVL